MTIQRKFARSLKNTWVRCSNWPVYREEAQKAAKNVMTVETRLAEASSLPWNCVTRTRITIKLQWHN